MAKRSRRFRRPLLRQVISPETAAQVGNALRGVVSDRGTAAAAAVPGFTISGKTGTAQKVDPKGGYEQGKYVVSFSGYLPADHPEFVGLVVLDDAKTNNAGAELWRPRGRPDFFARSPRKPRVISISSRMRN